MGPLDHFIIARAPSLQQNNKVIFVAGGPSGALRGRGPLVFELKVTLDRYATVDDVVARSRQQRFQEQQFQNDSQKNIHHIICANIENFVPVASRYHLFLSSC